MNTDVITESIQQFNLKWTNYTANLLEILADKLNKGFLTDVTLSCEGTLIRAHKLVLSACSPYFEHLFEVYNESNPLIILNGVQLKDLKVLLQFMYRGEIKICENEVRDILKLSNDLQVKGLSDAKVNWAFNKSFENLKNELPQPVSKVPVTQPVPSDIKKPVKQVSPDTECNTENLKVNPSLPSTSFTTKRSLPPKAFMVYANIMRRKLAETYPNESPKNISVRIGDLWKQLSNDEKMKFYEMAKWQTDSESVPGFTPEGDEQNDNLKRKRSNEDVKSPLNRNNPSAIKYVFEDDDDDVEFIEVTKNLVASTSNGNS